MCSFMRYSITFRIDGGSKNAFSGTVYPEIIERIESFEIGGDRGDRMLAIREARRRARELSRSYFSNPITHKTEVRVVGLVDSSWQNVRGSKELSEIVFQSRN